MTFDPLSNRWVTLTPFADADIPELRAAADDPRLWEHTLGDGCGEGFDRGLAQARADAAAGRRHAFVVRTPGGAVVGSTAYIDLSLDHKTVEIGHTWYAVAAQGTAVNPASKRLLLAHAFEALGLNRVQFVVDARNARSLAAVAKLGAVREGLLRRHRITYTGRVRDTVVFSVLADEWPAVRDRLDARLAAFDAGLGERPA